MAQPVEYEHTPRNLKQELYPPSQTALDEHPEAILDVYAILQLLRDKGILEIIKGGLGSIEKMMEVIAETLEREEVVRTVRNVTVLVKMIGSIEPEVLENAMKSLSNATEGAKAKKPPSLLHLLGQLSGEDTRRALGPLAAALQSIGRHITETPKEETAHAAGQSA
ncbi:MAG TPA: DUF1641 domain-containing protein [Verrucomicrobiae bacterium]|jgi:uncharacterized protein YjgD (DUF1641 family)|nr:DUF1641 domain-containing protein [Verrucomicrobiae bacterium]